MAWLGDPGVDFLNKIGRACGVGGFPFGQTRWFYDGFECGM